MRKSILTGLFIALIATSCLFFLILFFLSQQSLVLYQTQAQDVLTNLQKCDQLEYNRPDPMTVQGTASVKVPPEIISISFGIETLDVQASESLRQNGKILNNAIAQLRTIQLDDKEISTTGLSIYPQYISQYDKETQQYQQVFQGYKVTNNLKILTDKLSLAGQIIDLAIKNGITRVDSVQYDAKAKTKKQIKDSLIEEAIKDAQNRAELALEPINYKIKSVKSVNLNDYYYSQMNNNQNQYAKSQMADEAFAAPTTAIFASDQTITVSVSVSFIIEAKQ